MKKKIVRLPRFFVAFIAFFNFRQMNLGFLVDLIYFHWANIVFFLFSKLSKTKDEKYYL